jgi:ATP-dependent Clp protease protease subunit
MLKNLLISLLLLSFSTMAETSQFTETINLTEDNHVLFRGEVNSTSVAKASMELLLLSTKLSPTDTIYFVIDSGGGSVYAGMDMINVMEIVPQKIVTISIFAFSMAYSLSQRGFERFVASNGIMGQHRARGTFNGQFGDGEVEKRLELWQSIILGLNQYEADRMGVSLEEFKSRTKDEIYGHNQKAIDNGSADKMVKISCSPELIKMKAIVSVTSPFGGSSELTYSACPLIRTPIDTDVK